MRARAAVSLAQSNTGGEMNRKNRIGIIRSGTTKAMKGLEIAPWLAPIAAKRDGYNIRTLDVFDLDRLRANTAADPNLKGSSADLIEELDFVGSATEIAALVPADQHGTFDYIVSSHNFEHLANPVKFLRGCETLLKAGGFLSMAVPDRRATFDFFRPHTGAGDWLAAYLDDRSRPSFQQSFEATSAEARLCFDGEEYIAHSPGWSKSLWSTVGDAKAAFDLWQHRRDTQSDEYCDTHCTVMTPASLELLLVEMRALGLISLETDSISRTYGVEFFVRLRKPQADQVDKAAAGAEDIRAVRSRLMRQIIAEYGVQGGYVWSLGSIRHWPPVAGLRRLSRKVRTLGRRVRGKT